MPTDHYLLSDLLVRSRALSDSAGVIEEVYDTDVYGNSLIYSAPGAGGDWWTDTATTTLAPINDFIFTGRRYDQETTIYFYRTRYYSQIEGRFVSRDPIASALAEWHIHPALDMNQMSGQVDLSFAQLPSSATAFECYWCDDLGIEGVERSVDGFVREIEDASAIDPSVTLSLSILAPYLAMEGAPSTNLDPSGLSPYAFPPIPAVGKHPSGINCFTYCTLEGVTVSRMPFTLTKSGLAPDAAKTAFKLCMVMAFAKYEGGTAVCNMEIARAGCEEMDKVCFPMYF